MDKVKPKDTVFVECLKDGRWSQGPREGIVVAEKGKRYEIHSDLAEILEKVGKVKILRGDDAEEAADEAEEAAEKEEKGKGKGKGKGGKGLLG